MRIFLSYCFVFLALLLLNQNLRATDSEKLDTIIKVEGKIMPVNVTKVTSAYISFEVPGDKQIYTIQRKEVHKIIYKNGRIEEYNKPVVMMIDDFSWEAVWLTDDKAEVTQLYRRGSIKAKSPPSSRSPKAAKKSATIRLQKKAAAIKGVVVLVKERKSTGGYGEYPGYYITGDVYGLEPLTEGEDANAGKNDGNALKGGVVL